jgi:manganese efflux pump family protein
MDAWWTLVLLAFGLASDAMAVAIATAIRARHVPLGGGMEFGLWCGCFQGIMPALGYAGALAAGAWFAAVDHWVAFVVLGTIGLKIAWDGLKGGEAMTPTPWPGLRMQLSLALATSVDALVAGVTLPSLGLGILRPALVIGAVTLLLVLAGTFLGRHLGLRIGRRAELVGGLLLVLIGTRILLSHLLGAQPAATALGW